MGKVIIQNDFWDLFPNAEIAIVIAKGINNAKKDEVKYLNMLKTAQLQAFKFLPNDEFSSNEIIRVWRDAFTKFKTKKGARSSIESLLKRTKNDNQLAPINPLVDIYNSISLSYGFPCGGEDIDKIDGNMLLTKANGTEDFITYGTDVSESPYEGELVYKDNLGIICRCLNWREGKRTILTEYTTNAVLCIENIQPERNGNLLAAVEDLVTRIRNELGGEIYFKILNKKDFEVNF